MERTDAMRLLPGVYGEALLLRDAGLDDDRIADALGLEREAIGALLTIGERKLAALLRRG